MGKNKINFFCIFFLLISNSLSNICEDIVLNKKYFNLNSIKNKESEEFSTEIGTTKIHAFTYNHLDHFEFTTKTTLFDYYNKAKGAEGKKIHLYGLVNFAEQQLLKIGYDIRSSRTNFNNFLDNVEENVEKNYGKDLSIKELQNEIAKARNDLNYGKSQTNLLIDSSATAIFSYFGIMATSFITKFLSLPYTASLASTVFFALTPGIIIAHFWNRSFEKEIEKQKENFRKYTYMMELVFYKIKNLDWLENNLILTGISLIDYCNKYAVKFDYEYDLDYYDRNNKRIKEQRNKVARNMARRTCVLKREECPNEEQCEENIMEKLECLAKRKRGEKITCPIFEINDCTLNYKKKIYDL